MSFDGASSALGGRVLEGVLELERGNENPNLAVRMSEDEDRELRGAGPA